jgi:hypothetical protein
MVLVLAAVALVSEPVLARGKGRSGGGRSVHAAGTHHHHARSRVFVGAFAGAPMIWPWWAYAPYAAAAPVYYVEQSDFAEGEWLYCREANTYFPYIADCAGGWERVRPQWPPPG